MSYRKFLILPMHIDAAMSTAELFIIPQEAMHPAKKVYITKSNVTLELFFTFDTTCATVSLEVTDLRKSSWTFLNPDNFCGFPSLLGNSLQKILMKTITITRGYLQDIIIIVIRKIRFLFFFEF